MIHFNFTTFILLHYAFGYGLACDWSNPSWIIHRPGSGAVLLFFCCRVTSVWSGWRKTSCYHAETPRITRRPSITPRDTRQDTSRRFDPRPRCASLHVHVAKMMEEIDRFQVPPVNGETQPLVRGERRRGFTLWAVLCCLMLTGMCAVSMGPRCCIATAVWHNLRLRASGSV